MRICLHKDISRLPYNLVWDGTSFRRLEQSEDLSNDLLVDQTVLEELEKLQIVIMPRFPSEEYRKIYNDLRMINPPWALCMPKDKFIGDINQFGKELVDKLTSIDLTYYLQHYKKSNQIFAYLQPAFINKEYYDLHSLSDPTLASFRPDSAGFSEVPKYSSLETVTGRLKVTSGPQILLLKKEHREQIFQSRFGKEGAIYEFDYKSVEPRVILAKKGMTSIPDDIYLYAKNEVFHNRDFFTRDVVKKILLRTLYGAMPDSIAKDTNLKLEEAEDAIATIEDLFGIRDLKEELIKENEANDKKYIKNHYKRHVSTVDARNAILVNRYAQSTAMDVVKYGFSQIITYLLEMDLQDKVFPLMVLHDALYVDIHNTATSYLPTFCKIGSIGIPGFEDISFYLKTKKLINA